ncbi:MAG: hypothetical protein KJ675_14760, partial [Gammaproteobacteria bacterium]|nr:hypothetical protein [Gammaproteobacteria bacterium]MBU1962432.1 hypothetical protein [Gammaproteobacteria bacterium]
MGLDHIVTLAAHHELTVDPERLVHDYQLDGSPLGLNRILRIFQDIGLKAQRVRFNWRKLSNLGAAYPALGILRDGSTLIFAGFEEDEESGEQYLVVFDTTSDEGETPFHFFGRQALHELWRGDLILVKKNAPSATDAQEFGLRWFVSEAARQGHIFAEIALIALFMHALALA